MATNLILSKESSESEIKAYFNAVLKLSQSDNEFPINLDEVWMLVYGRKSDAVEALQKDFMQDVDYLVLRQNPQNPNGGRPANEYKLTVSCMEFFIARKVRPVFEVYRKVFHHAMQKTIVGKKPKREPSLTTQVRVGLEWVKGVSDMLSLNDSSKLLLLGKVAEPLGLPIPDYTPSKGILKPAGELLKANGCNISAQAFNQKMIGIGYMVEKARQSSKGVKKFKSIIGGGLEYGENQVNPNNPKETQPLYYENKFSQLLNFLK